MLQDPEQPFSAAAGVDDLFCSRESSLPRHAPAHAIVTLRVEAASAKETKATVFVIGFFTFCSYAALIGIVIVKAVSTDDLQLFKTTALEQSSVAIGAVCLAFLGARVAVFVHRVLRTWHLHQTWRPRRKRMAGLAFALGVIQVVNLVFWIVPNAYILALFPTCAWFEVLIVACGVVRWTCWNSSLLVYLVMGSSLLAWKGPSKGSAAKPSQSRADVQPQAESQTYLIGLDAPWWYHLNKLPLWLCFEAAVLVSTANPEMDKFRHGLIDSHAAPPYNCPQWSQGRDCKMADTTAGKWVIATSIGLTVVSALYLLWYCICMLRVYRQLSQRRFAAFRPVNIMFQLQMRTVFLTFKVLFISATILWFYRIDSCMSFFFTWLGMLPMQLIASALAWFTLWQYMPQDSASDPVLQVWLQEVAWTEGGMPAQVADRNARAANPQEAHLLQSEPMFNFETALKMHKWGTASFINALSDLKVWRTVHHSVAKSGSWWHRAPLVHTGFYSAWVSKGLDRQVITHLKELYDTGAVQRDAQIRITGHSLGGALAMLAAHDIAVELHPPRMQVYTIGCPYLGNHEFARAYSALVPDTWHIMNERDTVTRVGKFLFLFKRPGHRVVVSESGDMLVRPSPLELKVQLQRGSKVKHHLLRSYRAALVACLLAEFSHRGGGQASMIKALGLADSKVLAGDLVLEGVDWQKLRRIAQWGSSARLKLLPQPSAEQKCRLQRFCRLQTHKDGGNGGSRDQLSFAS
ncbi:hypothetical protein WJX73_002360 [Symbiochloris irregularis]|uniref:Fungal lipase-type domain-containing protein n=1 Tax=Symbiochloris irregularis TaxID=706552 RepID=A0AAW1NLF4_9CHLO